jgi:peptide/nickel transport system ATP-binding protein
VREQRISTPALLEVRGLAKSFELDGRRLDALKSASFAVERGEIVALVGESGSGKSTIARLILRLLPPSAGEIRLNGTDVLKSRGVSAEYRRRVQMIFQDPFASLNPVHRIRHHLERPLRRQRGLRDEAELARRVHELLELVGLSGAAEVAAKFPHELSGGQRQRVAIARALAVEPELIVADEPVSMLDVSIRAGILELMERLKNAQNVGILYITHDIASARHVADRIIVLSQGEIVESGPSEQIVRNPQHPYTRALIAAVPDPRRRRPVRSASAQPPSA